MGWVGRDTSPNPALFLRTCLVVTGSLGPSTRFFLLSQCRRIPVQEQSLTVITTQYLLCRILKYKAFSSRYNCVNCGQRHLSIAGWRLKGALFLARKAIGRMVVQFNCSLSAGSCSLHLQPHCLRNSQRQINYA